MLPIWQIAMIVGKDCAESVTVANPVMNVIAWKVFEELGQETTLNRQITENNIERDSMGTRILDFYRLFPQLFRAEIEMYQAFKDHAYFLGMVASDLYHNRKNDTALLKIWEKNENKKLLDELREIHIEDYESTTKSEHIRHINGKTIEISNLIELHYIRRTMNKFYTMTHSSLTKSDEERIENSKVLFQKLYDFRLDVYTEIMNQQGLETCSHIVKNGKDYKLCDFWIASSYKSYLTCTNYYDYAHIDGIKVFPFLK